MIDADVGTGKKRIRILRVDHKAAYRNAWNAVARSASMLERIIQIRRLEYLLSGRRRKTRERNIRCIYVIRIDDRLSIEFRVVSAGLGAGKLAPVTSVSVAEPVVVANT